MALSYASAGTANAASGTSPTTVATTAALAVGDVVLVVMSYDNSGSSGADPLTNFAVSPAAGAMTSVSAQTGLNDPGAASAGVAVRATAYKVTSAIASGTNMSISWTGTVVVRAIAMVKVTSSSGAVQYRTNSGATGTNQTATGTPALTTPSVNANELVLCWAAHENGANITGDADTTNGSWGSIVTVFNGSGATGIATGVQGKVVTATATQAFNPTGTSSDWVLGALIFGEDVTGTSAQTMAAFTSSATGVMAPSGTVAVTLADATAGSGNATPTLVSVTQTAWGTNLSGSRTSSSIAVQSGDLIVVMAASEDSINHTPNTISDTATDSWSSKQQETTSSYCGLRAWVATANSTGSITITVTENGSNSFWGFIVFVWRNHGGVGNTGLAHSQAGVNPPTGAVTCSARSAACTIYGDWQATNPASHAWATVNGSAGTEDVYTSQASHYDTGTNHWLDVGSAGSKTFGFASISTTSFNWNLITVEIKAGTTIAGATGSVSPIGSVAVTLQPATSTASGTETISGTSAQTMAAFTSSASGTVTAAGVSGTVAATLQDFTSSASGAETISGTSARTLADATSSASGTETISGTSARTLADATSTASGTETISGTSAQTLQAFASTATAVEAILGTSAQTLANATSTVAGVVTNPVTGTSSQTLQSATSTASGTETISGTSSQTLQNATSTASGIETISGASAPTLQNATSTASGQETISGTSAQTLQAFTGSASGAETISGTSATTLQNATSSAAGLETITGTSAQTTAAFTSTAAGVVDNGGNYGAAVLDPFTSIASGTVQEQDTGTASPVLQNASASATGTITYTGSAAVTLGNATSSASGQLTVAGAGAATLGNATASGSGSTTPPATTGSAAIVLQPFTSTATGHVSVSRVVGRLTVLVQAKGSAAAGVASKGAVAAGVEAVGSTSASAGAVGTVGASIGRRGGVTVEVTG